MRSVLITGGCGFIGLNLAQQLTTEGYRVRLLDNLSPQIHGVLPNLTGTSALQNPNVELIRGDVRLRSDWDRALYGVDCVVHFAAETGTAQSMYEIERYTNTNMLGTALLMDILANAKHSVKRVILASSRSIYGEGAYACARCGTVYPQSRSEEQLSKHQWDPACPTCGGPIQVKATAEDAKTQPASIYAATKLAQEDIVRIAGNALGIGTVIFRFQNVYGEGQSLKNPYTGILSIFSNRIRQQLPVYLFEDGEESRDFVHVSDVVEAVALAVRSSDGDGHTLNVGSGKPTSVRMIAETLKKEFGDPTEAIVSAQYRLGDIRHCYADLSEVYATLGFVPKVDVAEGLDRFVRWVKTQPIEADGLERANRELAERGLMAQAAAC